MDASTAVLVVLGGLAIAFFGKGFVRLTAGLLAGLWFGYAVGSSMGVSFGGQLIGVFIGFLVFLVFFTTGMMLYREVLSIFAGFYLGRYVLAYIDLESIARGFGLPFLGGTLTYIIVSLLLAGAVYVVFRVLMAAGLSLVG